MASLSSARNSLQLSLERSAFWAMAAAGAQAQSARATARVRIGRMDVPAELPRSETTVSGPVHRVKGGFLQWTDGTRLQSPHRTPFNGRKFQDPSGALKDSANVAGWRRAGYRGGGQ